MLPLPPYRPRCFRQSVFCIYYTKAPPELQWHCGIFMPNELYFIRIAFLSEISNHACGASSPYPGKSSVATGLLNGKSLYRGAASNEFFEKSPAQKTRSKISFDLVFCWAIPAFHNLRFVNAISARFVEYNCLPGKCTSICGPHDEDGEQTGTHTRFSLPPVRILHVDGDFRMAHTIPPRRKSGRNTRPHPRGGCEGVPAFPQARANPPQNPPCG